MKNDPITKAVNLFNTGDKRKARDILLSLLQEKPGNVEAWYGLAVCEEDNHKKLYYIKKVLELDPENIQAKRALEILNATEQKTQTSEATLANPNSIAENSNKVENPQLINSQYSKSGTTQFIPATCPNCGGVLMLPKDRSEAFCNYCGGKFLINEPINQNQTNTIENLLKLAHAMQESGSYVEANAHYTRVLELDAENIDGWIGKAETTGLQSTLAYKYMTEMISLFYQVQKIVSAEKRDELKHIISRRIISVTRDCLDLARKNLDIKPVWYPGDDWGDFVQLCKFFIDISQQALYLDDSNIDALQFQIDLSRFVLEPTENYTTNGRCEEQGRGLRKFWLDKFLETTTLMKSKNKDYIIPPISVELQVELKIMLPEDLYKDAGVALSVKDNRLLLNHLFVVILKPIGPEFVVENGQTWYDCGKAEKPVHLDAYNVYNGRRPRRLPNGIDFDPTAPTQYALAGIIANSDPAVTVWSVSGPNVTFSDGSHSG